MAFRLALVGLILVSAGCISLPPLPPFASVDALISDAIQAARAPGMEQKAALARAEQAYGADPTPLNRLRVGALLATLAEPLRDDARALEFLDPLADASQPGIGRFAALLSSQIAERRRAAREADRQARERERAEKERDKREEGLRQQLEALKGIERGILEREERLRRRQN
ncbi:MAG TPA: hypothetical protein VM183_21025 [Burkholderiales bacterium]|nr:hypothetical protein [Burkholderiales bacterium]